MGLRRATPVAAFEAGGGRADSPRMRERRLLPALLTTLAITLCLAPAAGAAGPRAAYVASHLGDSLLPFDALGATIGTPIPLGGDLWGVAITPDGSTAYVSDDTTNAVIPVDTATNTPGTPIPVGANPRTIGIRPDGATAYVADLGSDTVTPIDTATNTAGTPIPVGTSPHGIAISPDGSRVYVADLDSGGVSVIDTATNTVVDTILTGTSPYTIAITPNGATVYATNPRGNDVAAIDTATGTVTTIPVGAPTYGVGVAPDGKTAYVSPSGTSSIVPIDTATNTPGTPIQIGTLPETIAITPDGRTAWVTDVGADSIQTLDLATGVAGAPVSTGQGPIGLAITPDRAPTAAFTTSADDLTATLDASAASDPDGTIASYAWSFGDGQTATSAQPTVRHVYAQPGDYTATLTVTDDEGCSTALVFTGETASCTGSPAARIAHTVSVAAPAPPAPPAPAPAAVVRQAIERFTLDARCVRLGRDGKAPIGLRLLLAKPGAVQVQVYRATKATNGTICPKLNPHAHYPGPLRKVTALPNVATQPAVAASVSRRVTRSFELRPGLYRIGVRAYDSGGRLTRASYRWVRVLVRAGR